MNYTEMAKQASPESVEKLASILLRIYEADRTQNCGAVNGEAVLCHAFAVEARQVLTDAGVLT